LETGGENINEGEKVSAEAYFLLQMRIGFLPKKSGEGRQNFEETGEDDVGLQKTWVEKLVAAG